MARRPSNSPVSSKYGWRTHPITGKRQHHDGEDQGWASGYQIYAPIDCMVQSYGYSGGYGNLLILREGPVEFRLAHLASSFVRAGARLREGQHIATMGSTGNAAGAHVHTEVRINGRLVDPASMYSSTAGGVGIPIDTRKKDVTMHLARHPNGSIALIGETTYQHLSPNQYANSTPAYGNYIQYTAEGFQQQLIDVEARRQFLAAATRGQSASVDMDAVAAKVKANLAADFQRLEGQIAEINEMYGGPTAEDIAKTTLDQLAGRVQG